jgi:O-antigen/teichoic acid export membrane protein
MARGALWLMLARLGDRLIGMLSMVLLARLLAPADYGIVAMAGTVLAATELLRAFGFELALIQSQEATRLEYDTAWTLNALLGAGIALLVAGLAYPGAAFYDETRLAPVLLVLAVRPALQGLRNVGVVNFRKEFKFHREIALSLTTKAVAVLTTVPLAFALRSYWALVYGMLISTCVDLFLTYAMHPFRPRPSLGGRQDLMRFSKWLFLNNLGFFLGQRGPDLIVGKLAGTRALGLFSLSYEVANLPTTEFISTINGAAFPGYSRHGKDVPRLRSEFLGVMGFIFLLLLPAGIGLILLADQAVLLLLGERWIDAVPAVRILTCAALFHGLGTNSGYIYMAIGKPRYVTLVTAGQLVVLLPAVAVGARLGGVEGAAWAFVAAAGGLMMPLNYWLIRRELDLRTRDIVAALWRPVVASAAMAWCVSAARSGLSLEPGIPSAALLVAIGAMVYFATVFALWALVARPVGAESASLDVLRSRLAQLSVR